MLSKLPIDSIRKMLVEEQDKLAREVGKLETHAKSATDAHKQGFPMAGKVICVIEERLNELKSDRNPDGSPKKRLIASNTPLAKYWETVTKVNGKSVKLNNHALSCAVAFGTYVRSELITEPDYDKCVASWLEKAASISTELGGAIDHPAVMQAAEVLRDRPKDGAKALQNILDSVKDPKPLTVEQAQKQLDKIMESGLLSTVISAVGAQIAHTVDEEEGRNAYFGMLTAHDMFAVNMDGDKRRFDDDKLDAWTRAYQTSQNSESTLPERAAASVVIHNLTSKLESDAVPMQQAA
ncbi:MAG TPA: hypothetical protein VH413_15995 [Verrucomicrobiae bacterium]|jgi:hypothetical protein|nr:hypothetical protein [Verrucomicrobiae bacterium]